jgi:Predicted carbamoyl transferase, NodU family
MIVLGLNGWSDGTHDPAAALVVDGRLVGFVEEERVIHKRHALSALPVGATRAVLENAGVAFADVDIVACGWDLPGYFGRKGREWSLSDDDFIRRVTGSSAHRRQHLVWVPHHEAHAASAFFASGMERAAVLVVDGQGEEYSISLFDGQPDGLRLRRQWSPAKSLGFFYEAATTFCGFGYLNTGKTMGLAAYGPKPEHQVGPRWHDDDIETPIADGLEEQAIARAWLAIFDDAFETRGAPTAIGDAFTAHGMAARDTAEIHRPDVAAIAQSVTEEVLIELAKYAVRECGSRNLCLAGGVALNCVANGLLLDWCDELFVQPAANDSGVAIGAALAVAKSEGEHLAAFPGMTLGHRYEDEAIAHYLRETCNLGVIVTEDPVEAAVDRLLQGQIVGWFQGGMEGGPRALGARSILALPQDHAMKSRVNMAKGREPWRPLAPSLLRSEMSRVFGRDLDSPYMLLSLPMTAAAVAEVPAVSHVDSSSRPQTVVSGSGRYSDLLERLRDKTGIGLVLNTSFNSPGEPIVCTPADAVRTFMTTGLNSLVLGSCLLEKGH